MAKPVNPNIIFIPGTSIPWMTTKYGGDDGHVLRSRISARISPTSMEAQSIRAALTKGIGRSIVACVGVSIGAACVAANEGVLEGMDLLDRDIKTNPPTVPESKGGGTLRTSWDVRPKPKKGYAFRIVAGFSAVDERKHPYAVYVHEMTDEAYGKKINWTTPGSGPKFLEYGLKRNADNIVRIVIDKVMALTAKP
jgi:hypothetical protein